MMKEKIKILGEIIIVAIITTAIIFFSGWFTGLAGYQSKLRLLLICINPMLLTILPLISCMYHKDSLKKLGYHKENILQQGCLICELLVIIILFTVILPLLFGIGISQLVGQPYYEWKIIIFRLIYYFIFIGFSEEFVFRGYFHNMFQHLFQNEWISIICSAVLFGVMHYITGKNIALVIETFLAGILYGVFAHKCKGGSIWVTSVAHGLYDAILVIIACAYL